MPIVLLVHQREETAMADKKMVVLNEILNSHFPVGVHGVGPSRGFCLAVFLRRHAVCLIRHELVLNGRHPLGDAGTFRSKSDEDKSSVDFDINGG